MFRSPPTRTADHHHDDNPPVPYRSMRPSGLGVATLIAAVIGTAILVATHEHQATSAKAPDVHGANVAVRDFLTSAVVDHETYLACQYLTPAAQADVGRLEGAATTCADVMTSSPATLFGVESEGGITHLSLRTTVRGSTARVVARHPGQAPITFVLRPTTADEDVSFGAPATAWRIAAGELGLFAAPTRPGASHAHT
jgi:hypothetical protein